MNNPHRMVAAPGPRHGEGTPRRRWSGGHDGLAMISPAARQTERAPWGDHGLAPNRNREPPIWRKSRRMAAMVRDMQIGHYACVS